MEGESANLEVVGVEKFKEQYYFDLSETLRQKCSWDEVETRLLANDGYYLTRAQALNEGGILFGVDEEGNPLFADGGEEPIMTGMTYADTRNRVLYEYDGENMKQKDGKPIETGYEMFPVSGEFDSREFDKSPEIIMFETTTGMLLIQPENNKSDRKSWRGSWLKSDHIPLHPRYARFNPCWNNTRVYYETADRKHTKLGVRRMLRVRK